LIKDKRLNVPQAASKTLTYHDPCYLGRYSGTYAPPRDLLKALPDLRLVEMELSREQGFCCGGGGGHVWMDEPVGRRINQIRMEQAMKTGAEVIAVACPYCLQMMDDAIRSLESPMRAVDISELIADALVTP
jgi:Fe-S oxidoreductase